MTGTPRVTAVVVTYNRRDLLLESLAAVHGQGRAPDAVIVVDNASEDGTAAAVRDAFPAVRLAEFRRNSGGAGGFAGGIALALAQDADVIWLMDDDTVPEPGALGALLAARDRITARAGRPPALVASRVLWTDGREHPMNTPRRKPFAAKAERLAASAVGCVPIRSASFVSILVDAGECRRRGLPRADYFLWNDDFEFTTRLLRGNTGLLCPIWMFKDRAPLAPLERLAYGGSTLRRWARTFARSHDRRTLRESLFRGIAAGVRTSPRPTDEVLADAGLPVPAPGRE